MKTIYNQPIDKVIQARHSVRNYTEETLSEEIISQIENYIITLKSPFAQNVTIQLVQKSAQTEDVKLGTYGVIKGASYYFVTSCDNEAQSLIALGYALEKVVLYCTSLGLGTVWLGGTFNKSGFAKAIDLKDNQMLPIVAPVGHEGGKKSLLGNFFSKSTNRRKEFAEICFENTFENALSMERAGEFAQALEMVRLAPSAVNKQPWRMIKDGNMVHFYLTATKVMNYVDLGIGLCHFDLTAQECGLQGEFSIREDGKLKNSKDSTYMISWTKSEA